MVCGAVHGVWIVGMHKVMWDEAGFEVLEIVGLKSAGE